MFQNQWQLPDTAPPVLRTSTNIERKTPNYKNAKILLTCIPKIKMATTTMATALGVAMLLYFVLTRRISMKEEVEIDGGADSSKEGERLLGRRRKIARRPAHAPSTWREAAATVAETMRFTYSETLGKWPIGDLAFGIKYLMRKQGNLQISSEFAKNNCMQLKDPELMGELIQLLRLLTLCMLFSKKPFPVFLESASFVEEDVLIQEPKAGLLRPAFTVVCDKSSKSFLLLIRGTHSIKDTLTAVTGAVVPFHHLVLHEGGIGNLVLGYAHCGMVAAARWIAKCTTPCLLKAVEQHPDYSIKIIGHSLGGGTAALLTYILREREEFSSSTCIAFAPAASMTWDLAESGKHFITTVINGSDMVPSFSTASIDILRSEVTASSWLNDLRDQIQSTRFLNVIYRSASALGSRLPSVSSAKARVADAGALFRPVSNNTRVVINGAQSAAQAVATGHATLPSWSCMGARRRTVSAAPSTDHDNTHSSTYVETSPGRVNHSHTIVETEADNSNISESELWFELEKELGSHDEEDMQAMVKEITKEETEVLKEAVENNQPTTLDSSADSQQLYPPGKIMHMVAASQEDEGAVGVYATPRGLYNKIRLSPSMVNDHYMPMYKKTMEMLIDALGKEEDAREAGEVESCCASLLD